jgi:NAD(P)-dependent dehydrogenase (short-subunit alcohol dehydrogenase family)
MADPLFDIAGRAVLLAGAAGGLGRELAEAFAERGARLLLADVDDAGVSALRRRLPGAGHAAVALDITDEASCAAAIEAAQALGGLDALVNAVGIFRTAPAIELALDTFEATQRLNVTGAFLIARAAARAWLAAGRGGRIVTLASVSSRVANPGYAAYAASKAALAQLTRILALEWAAHGIAVNAVAPAMTPTPLTEEYLRKTANLDYALSRIPMGRFGAPRDIVGAVLLLIAPAGAFITGQTIYVDGGRTLV